MSRMKEQLTPAMMGQSPNSDCSGKDTEELCAALVMSHQSHYLEPWHWGTELQQCSLVLLGQSTDLGPTGGVQSSGNVSPVMTSKSHNLGPGGWA